jgi:hypothetical protein
VVRLCRPGTVRCALRLDARAISVDDVTVRTR